MNMYHNYCGHNNEKFQHVKREEWSLDLSPISVSGSLILMQRTSFWHRYCTILLNAV